MPLFVDQSQIGAAIRSAQTRLVHLVRVHGILLERAQRSLKICGLLLAGPQQSYEQSSARLWTPGTGLLHDLGIIVNLWVLPKEFLAAFACAKAEAIPLHEAEQRVLGFTHCESGSVLAARWELPPDLAEVVAHHHNPEKSLNHAGLVAMVELSDVLCRMSGLNHGYIERREVNLLAGASFSLLSAQYQALRDFDWARLTFELDSYMDEVQSLVHAIYRT